MEEKGNPESSEKFLSNKNPDFPPQKNWLKCFKWQNITVTWQLPKPFIEALALLELHRGFFQALGSEVQAQILVQLERAKWSKS